MDKDARGVLAEHNAAKLMKEKGYTILDMNVNYPKIGELDIVCKKAKTLVIVEVKYRSTKDMGDPIESVTKSKISKIIKATERYIIEHHLQDYEVRFDIIADRDGVQEHIEEAFYGYWA
ncbi:MAG: YraN family protein [Clostridia bacterium]|nr:YraN family protein [Clostridia bacterium]